FEILVATDIMSRGIDIEKIDLIINYNVPQDAEDYVHRVGRTARAKSTGVAITLINHKEISNFYRIEKLIDTEVRKLPLPPGIPPGPEYKPRQSSNRDYQRNTKTDYGRKKNKNSHKKKFQNRNDSNTSVNKGIHK
ncbi:MAG: C-terminal helicase domain-containing protein, partial [Bacteroidales bacterium]|nr:C-terminal helicase domain-containing protein [Bacteroidales bacterium]